MRTLTFDMCIDFTAFVLETWLKMVTGVYKWYQMENFDVSYYIFWAVFPFFQPKNGLTTADNVALKFPDFQT